MMRYSGAALAALLALITWEAPVRAFLAPASLQRGPNGNKFNTAHPSPSRRLHTVARMMSDNDVKEPPPVLEGAGPGRQRSVEARRLSQEAEKFMLQAEKLRLEAEKERLLMER